MWINFNFPGIKVYPWGSPYNTGDGIKMALDVGAALWHMVSVEWDCPCIKIPSEIYAVVRCKQELLELCVQGLAAI
jgi:hypothetical protein